MTRFATCTLIICFFIPLLSASCGTSGNEVEDGFTSEDLIASDLDGGALLDSGLASDSQAGLCKADDPSKIRPAGWTTASHCKGEPPDYDLLFNDNAVLRFDITIAVEDYQASMDNLESIMSTAGPRASDDSEDPMFIPVTISFNGLVWDKVGMRYKGNSSLQSSYNSGIRKLSFRLSFDKYEDDNPELEDQRFYGFKKMTFSNGFKDSSLIRDKLAADMFRAGGVPAARGAFARVYVDFGEGPVYFGLYTMIEDPSDEMLGVQFDDDSGNLYKPEGDGATWDSYDQDSFEKKTNEDALDWSDVLATFEALHGDRSDPEAWRIGLDSVFNTEAFLKWLAINQAMMNWDSYGTMDHNYYLYGDPVDGGRLVWFPWDLNEAMLSRASGPGPKSNNSSTVMLDEIGDNWPMIRFLLDDPVYREQYREELLTALDTALEKEMVLGLMDSYHDLIAPYVVGEEGESSPYTFLTSDQEFETSISDSSTGLKAHIEARHTAVLDALSN